MSDQKPVLTPAVKTLGFVSLFTDISSEMVYPLNPIFITSVLNAPVWTLGLIEGIAESTASLLKLYSGKLSDRFGARKPFAVWGYALSAIGKPLMATAGIWPTVLGARFLDRFGKGVRTAPRDALITENVAPEHRGKAFGFHRSLDTTGAVLGPLIGWLYLRSHPADIRALYNIAFIPAVIGVILLAALVKEKRADRSGKSESSNPPNTQHPTPNTKSGISPEYKRFLWIVGLFSIGNSSDAFLLLRARGLGVSPEQALLLYSLFNVVEACLGYPVGRLTDRIGRRPVIAVGYGVFALVYLGFALGQTALAAWLLFPIYGLYYTLTNGSQRALAADLSRKESRGADIGLFHMLVGLAALPASLLAGWMYGSVAPSAPFILGAACAGIAALLMAANPGHAR